MLVSVRSGNVLDWDQDTLQGSVIDDNEQICQFTTQFDISRANRWPRIGERVIMIYANDDLFRVSVCSRTRIIE